MTASLNGQRGCGRGYALAVALFCTCGFLAADVVLAAGKAVTHTVVIDGVKYAPESLAVKRGDTVVWINKDPFPHTVTAPGAFDSHAIAAGKSWRYTTRKSGEFAYICTLHPNMKGTLKVE
jgi:plastocyanin